MRQIVDQAPVAIAVLEGPEHCFSLTNDSFRALFGQRARAGVALLEAVPELTGHPLARAVAHTFRTGEPQPAEQAPLELGPREDALRRRHVLEWSCRALEPGDGSSALLLFCNDVSEQARAREALEGSLRLTEQFIAVLGHDLRNPLNAIVIAAKLLKASTATAEHGQLRYVGRIAASAERISRTISHLLDLARTRLGDGIRLERARLDLAEVIVNVADELGTVHQDRMLACSVPAGVAIGEWDKDRLAQVFSNLIGNAFEHGTPNAPVTVALACDGDAAVVSVHNLGPAIAPELLGEIFSPYRRGSSGAGKTQGLGLGLFISQQIVQAHGGSIEVRSSPSAGTTFVVTLPRAERA